MAEASRVSGERSVAFTYNDPTRVRRWRRERIAAIGGAAPTTGADGDDSQPLIAYQTNRSGQDGIWLMQLDGSGDHQIAADAAQQALLPDWSSDGTQLAFTTRGGETEPLYVYDSTRTRRRSSSTAPIPAWATTNPRTRLTISRSPSSGRPVRSWTTSPRICGLWIGEVATGGVHRVTSHPGCDPREKPALSPDGTQLTYWTQQYDDAGNITATAVFVIGADGQGNRQLTGWETNAGDPDWSPDGDWIVYSTHPLRRPQLLRGLQPLPRAPRRERSGSPHRPNTIADC